MLKSKQPALPCLQTANIFLAQAEGQAWTASACDYQWTGGGLGVRDVVYLIWTSVSGSVQALLQCPVLADKIQGICHLHSLDSASAGQEANQQTHHCAAAGSLPDIEPELLLALSCTERWLQVEPSVAQQHEQELLHHYWDQLNEGLRRRNAAVYTEEQLQTDADLAFLDYTRFLIGSMWGNVSPESCSKMAGDMNQGMHKR